MRTTINTKEFNNAIEALLKKTISSFIQTIHEKNLIIHLSIRHNLHQAVPCLNSLILNKIYIPPFTSEP